MIRVRVPATSANCGVGFDTMGLALDWMADFTFEKRADLLVTGCPEAYAGPDNLVWQAYRTMEERLGEASIPVHIHIDSTIPFARGLGSSAACIVAGCAGALGMHGHDLNKQLLLEVAAQIEGHPDNVAPAIFGGLCVTVQDVMVRCGLAGWQFLALVPDYPVLTKEARKVLPDVVSHQDAALQAGLSVLFFEGMRTRKEALCLAALQDRLHEPYRKALIPDYEKVKGLDVPAWISGSGSTLLCAALDRNRLESIGQRAGLAYRLCQACEEGTVLYHE